MENVHLLLIRLKRGDAEAIESLYMYFAKRLYFYAVHTCKLSHEDAEEAVHATFVHVIEKIQSYDEVSGTGGGWIYAICRHIIIDMTREKKSQQAAVDRIVPPEDFSSVEAIILQKERNETFKRAWEKLTDVDRQELRRGRGRGPGRAAWHKAIQRLCEAVYSEE